MRFSLRTLLGIATVAPPALAACWFGPLLIHDYFERGGRWPFADWWLIQLATFAVIVSAFAYRVIMGRFYVPQLSRRDWCWAISLLLLLCIWLADHWRWKTAAIYFYEEAWHLKEAILDHDQHAVWNKQDRRYVIEPLKHGRSPFSGYHDPPEFTFGEEAYRARAAK